MVTPLRLRAVTSRPRGKWRSIFLTRGVQRGFLRMSGSPRAEGEVLSFLCFREVLMGFEWGWLGGGCWLRMKRWAWSRMVVDGQRHTSSVSASLVLFAALYLPFLFPQYQFEVIHYVSLKCQSSIKKTEHVVLNSPRSTILNTPVTLLLARRWKIFFSVGDDDKPFSMAESILERSAVSAAIVCDGWMLNVRGRVGLKC